MPEIALPFPTELAAPASEAQDVALSINLRHLHALSAVASTGSVARGAEQLCRVASAVTRSIGELEQVLGRDLFERRSRGMTLTAHGLRVLTRTQRIEAEFESIRQQLAGRASNAPPPRIRTVLGSIQNGRRLAVIAGLSDNGNMPAVATEFGITQPAVSSALRDLESGLGVALFDRTARGLRTTPAGEIVVLHFRRVLAELRHILPDLAACEGGIRGSVQIGALPLGRTQILPLAIASLVKRHPDLHMATLESPYESLVASLRRGDIDFILGALRPKPGPDLCQEALFVDRISVIARAGHPLAGLRKLGLDALRRSVWVLSRPGSPSRELFDTCFSRVREAAPRPAVETGDLAVVRALLLESDMLTAISAHQLRYEIRDGSLVVLDFPLTDTRRDIGLTRRVGALPSPGAEALMAEIRSVVGRSGDFGA